MGTRAAGKGEVLLYNDVSLRCIFHLRAKQNTSTKLLKLHPFLLMAFEINIKCFQVFHGTRKSQREKDLRRIQAKGGVCLTTYGLMVTSPELLNQDRHVWDYVILDEGHKIRNDTNKMAKAARLVKSENRLILSGTPIQNNLMELWALFDFVCFGTLLGDKRSFKANYALAIENGTINTASPKQQRLSEIRAQELRAAIKPHFLRRQKKTALGQAQSDEGLLGVLGSVKLTEAECQQTEAAPSASSTKTTDSKGALPPKNELTVWVSLTEVQREIYRTFLSSSRVYKILNSTSSPLAAMVVMKKLCDHPKLLLGQKKYHQALGLSTGDGEGSGEGECDGDEDASMLDLALQSHSTESDSDQDDAAGVQEPELNAEIVNAVIQSSQTSEQIASQSGKLMLLRKLLSQLQAQGNRVLIFSQSRQMLDMISQVMTSEDMTHLRLDGTIIDTGERQRLVDQFNQDESVFAFLLTTQVGGVGLTLTGADRVIIYDPSWNPSNDAQAVDRAYVIVYRTHDECGKKKKEARKLA
eukprot:m.57583 g.57583  ORF g.57583 m.57583 type:complete len:527 (+) comp11607_c0_seq4:669-2249(+)